MKRLGKVSHYAKQGFLILRSDWVPSLNDPVVDTNLQLVGIVKDVFGPVKMPYVAVKPKVKNPEEYVGQVLYVDERKRRKRPEQKGKGKGKKFKKKRPAPRKRG
ncbi:H/ACA RNA-protein complex protein Gar1 [Thermococcus sp. M39]|uniref:Gar1/Naf1 family protein n=1 Tax=unclassified Thermococcus TaxID=2627626 RepID=UPI00143A2DFD|nr:MULTISPECIES: Gar1/Naf1 family protein [unclassified Thermococcus]NJE07723.1 H/ACA RNA-protein complex protein Gar1 [Thermococcus sp. M39]NJE12279.1 H/ACA RNA-protein complex protein Gar1 [Thermococcus sp. LS2]